MWLWKVSADGPSFRSSLSLSFFSKTMDASIGEPFLLASYAVAHRLQKSKATPKSQRAGASVYATHEKTASGSSDGYVTVTVQGDGVHVLDVCSSCFCPSLTFSFSSQALNPSPSRVSHTRAIDQLFVSLSFPQHSRRAT